MLTPDVLLELTSLRIEEAGSDRLHHAVAKAAAGAVAGSHGSAFLLRDAAGPARMQASCWFAQGPPVVEAGEGPSHAALEAARPVVAEEGFSTWPAFSDVAERAGLRVAVAVPFTLLGDRTGCLTVYACAPLDTKMAVCHLEALAGPVAAQITTSDTLNDLQREVTGLREGLTSREVIGMAKGIIMRQEACTESQAFKILSSASQRLNQKLRDVARGVVAVTDSRATVRDGD